MPNVPADAAVDDADGALGVLVVAQAPDDRLELLEDRQQSCGGVCGLRGRRVGLIRPDRLHEAGVHIAPCVGSDGRGYAVAVPAVWPVRRGPTTGIWPRRRIRMTALPTKTTTARMNSSP